MVIIRCNIVLKPEEYGKMREGLQDQADKGVILLPPYCELLNEVPADEEVQVIRPDDRQEGAYETD